jgi:hypothetical protein
MAGSGVMARVGSGARSCFFVFAGAAGLAIFLAAFLTVFLTVFFVVFFVVFLAVFLTAFFAGVFAVFFAFLAETVLFARFFTVAPAARRDAFFVFFFFEDLRATTSSLITGQARIVGIDGRRRVYRVASASSENTEKTSGFRSRL